MAHIQFIAGRLCLDFVNTGVWDGSTLVKDYLLDPPPTAPGSGLVSWCREGGLLEPGEWPGPVTAAEIQRLRELRTALRRSFNTLADGLPLPPETLAVINGALAEAVPLALGATGKLRGGALVCTITTLVAVSAVEMLMSEERTRVRRCNGHACGWLFVDRSPAGRRRWCAMEMCGNRAKAEGIRARRLGQGAKTRKQISL